MLSIFSCTPGTCYGTDFDVYSGNGTGALSSYLSPIFGPFDSDGTFTGRKLMEIDGKLFSPTTDIEGDRSCSHRQLSGELCIPSFEAVPSTTSSLTPMYDGILVGGKKKSFTHFAHDPHVTYQKFKFQSTTATGIWVDKVMVQGRNVIVAYAKTQKYATRTTSSVMIRAITFSEDWKKHSSVILKQGNLGNAFNQYEKWVQDAVPQYVGVPTTLSKVYNFIVIKPKIDLPEITRNLNSCFDTTIYDSMLDLRPKDCWGDLCQQCIDSVNYCSVNVISFIRELRDWKKLIPKVGKLLDPKTYASVYLWFKYGITLTVQDTKALVTAFRQSYEDSLQCNKLIRKFAYTSQFTVSTIRNRRVDSEYRYKIAYDPYPQPVMNIMRELKRWGIYPTLEFSWDMIPFSFVVDWFTNVNDLLHEMDTHIYSQYFNVQWVCKSQKHTRVCFGKDYFPQYFVIGSIQHTNYQRIVKRTLDLPRWRLDLPTGFRNYAELTALIVQLKR